MAINSGRRFSFAVIPDRTGGARPGVFERAVEVVNLLGPAFALQIGDLIEGYTGDPVELSRQWAEADEITSQLVVPLHRVPGNHDIGSDEMRTEWNRRFGPPYQHFLHQDTLFLLLDTNDPPQPREALRLTDWDGPMPAWISERQVEYFESVLAEHPDPRWTFVLAHMPIWQAGGHLALHRLRAALGTRGYTMFAGHAHNYRRTVIDGRDHVRLGAAGGGWVLPENDPGNIDHITLVTVSADCPQLTTVLLSGILGPDGPRNND